MIHTHFSWHTCSLYRNKYTTERQASQALRFHTTSAATAQTPLFYSKGTNPTVGRETDSSEGNTVAILLQHFRKHFLPARRIRAPGNISRIAGVLCTLWKLLQYFYFPTINKIPENVIVITFVRNRV